MFFYYGTRSKYEIQMLMQALEQYELNTTQEGRRRKIHELYLKVRSTYFGKSSEALARLKEDRTVHVKDLTTWERIKFALGVE